MKISKDLEMFRQDTASASSEAEALHPHLTGLQGAANFSAPKWTLTYLARQLISAAKHTDTGLETLPMREFLELARAKRAFYHATETELRSGWWSALLDREFLKSPESAAFRDYLKSHIFKKAVAEIGPGEQIFCHRQLMRLTLGATHYLSVDLRKESEKFGATHTDALSFFSLFNSESIDAIFAFGVFNEPMSLQYPAFAPPLLLLPARTPEVATRAHCEHEYVRRLGREMFRALKPGGVLFGDGLHSRGFEKDVRTYIELAGFTPDLRGIESLSDVSLRKFHIRDPFFFVK